MNNKSTIFLHIPKNGGSTFHHILTRNYSDDETFSVKVKPGIGLDLQEFLDLPVEKKGNINLLKGHVVFGIHEELPQQSEYITFLRNPADRLISFYYYSKSKPGHKFYDKINKENMSLYDFVEWADRPDTNNAQIKRISGIEDTVDNMLNKAIENIENHFPFIGFVERFDESLLLFQHKYNIPDVSYLRVRTTKSRIDRKELDPETKKLISEKNRGDEELCRIMLERFEKEIQAIPNLSQKLENLKKTNKKLAFKANTKKKIKKFFGKD
jgi:hypothetical protein